MAEGFTLTRAQRPLALSLDSLSGYPLIRVAESPVFQHLHATTRFLVVFVQSGF